MGYETETAPSRRLLGLGLAVLFHALLLYGLMSGLGREFVRKVQTTVNVAILDQAKPTPPPPPPEEILEEQPEPSPKPQVQRPKAFVPQVETTIKTSTTTESAITSTSISAADATPLVPKAAAGAPAPAPAAPPQPKAISPRLIQGCAQPQYPQRSLEKGEEGLVVFRFMVGPDGAVKNSILVQSSGFDRLDEAAKKAFQRCKFIPGTVNGSPVQAWVRVPFRWRLQ